MGVYTMENCSHLVEFRKQSNTAATRVDVIGGLTECQQFNV